MAQQTLEDLKAANAADDKLLEEEAELKKTSEAKLDDDLEDDEPPKVVIPDSEEDDDDDIPAFMQTDEQRSKGDTKFTDGDVANVRRKLKGKLQKERSEKEVLAEENAALKAQIAGNTGSKFTIPKAPEAVIPAKMPMLSDFSYNEVQYQQAMQKWVQQESVSANQSHAENVAQSEARDQANTQSQEAVNKHYQRAETLVKDDPRISDEVYQNADTAVREAVESVIPGGGNTITDGLISRLGEGSERVLFFLGRNAAKRAEFVESLRRDKSGIEAAMMLGQLRNTFTAPSRNSNAPAPGTKINGDGSGGANVAKLKRQYEKASTVQERIDLKRTAKKSGCNVSGW